MRRGREGRHNDTHEGSVAGRKEKENIIGSERRRESDK